MSYESVNHTKTPAVSEILSALGNTIRLEMIRRLSMAETFGGQSITELSEGTGLARQTVTKHLDALTAVGLVKRREAGRATLYELQTEPINSAIDLLAAIPKDWERTQKKLNTYLENFNTLVNR